MIAVVEGQTKKTPLLLSVSLPPHPFPSPSSHTVKTPVDPVEDPYAFTRNNARGKAVVSGEYEQHPYTHYTTNNPSQVHLTQLTWLSGKACFDGGEDLRQWFANF